MIALLLLLADDGQPTFSKDVAPIFYARCAACHRPGEVGPFPLLGYADARKRARQIARVVEERVMPPWKPEPGHGSFLEERRLTDAQVSVILRWVEAGAPEGNPADLPPVPKFPEGWQLGKPDLILKMPVPFTVPAEGPDVYQHFVFPLDLPEDRYVRGVEVLPGNRKVVHHVFPLVDSSGAARVLDEKDPAPGYAGNLNGGFVPSGFLPGYVPGQIPRFFPEESGLYLRKGSDLVLQVHYHPSGKLETDCTVVGVYFSEKKPRRTPTGIIVGSEAIDIPPGERAYRVSDTFVLPVDLTVTDIWAHMHLLGKDVRVAAELPGGRRQPLLWIKDWDFNWQDTYRYKEPIRLPKGTKVRAEFVFDNSSGNPRNPNRPPKRVTFGEGSSDEMAGVVLTGFTDRPIDQWALMMALVAHYAQMAERRRGTK
jgi:hypothetical protein